MGNTFDETDRITAELADHANRYRESALAYREFMYWFLTIAQFYVGVTLFTNRDRSVPDTNYSLAQLGGYGLYGAIWLIIGGLLIVGKATTSKLILDNSHRLAMAFFVMQASISVAGIFVMGLYSSQNLPWWLLAAFLHWRASLDLPLLPRAETTGNGKHVDV